MNRIKPQSKDAVFMGCGENAPRAHRFITGCGENAPRAHRFMTGSGENECTQGP